MRWRHSKIPGDQPIETSKLGDFFKKGLAAHLVREISQNTMDNRQDGEKAVLRFQFRAPADPLAFAAYLRDLREHVAESDIEGSEVDWSNPRLLLIEDFGTRGLEGPVDDRHANASFAKFWHRTGDSNKGKGSSKGGRHGVGKVVNAEASRVRAFFGYSVRSGDPVRSTLLGRSYLKPHVYPSPNGPDVHGLGTFDRGTNDAPIAALVDADADAFAKAAGLVRKPHVSGLSIAVLWPKGDITPSAIKQAVLSECLYQVTSGELVVQIDDEVIAVANVRDALAKDAELARLLPLHTLIKATCAAKETAFRRPVAVVDPCSAATRLSKAAFDAPVLDEMRKAWLQGEPVLVEARVLIRRKGAPATPASFRVALMLAEAAQGAVACVRDDVTVRGAVSWGKRSAVALLLAQENELSGFLGDAEGPSHEDWDADYVSERYSYARETIRAVKLSLSGLYDALVSGDAEEPIQNALIDFFSWRAPADKKRPAPKPPKAPTPPIESRPPLVRVTESKDGFLVSATEAAKEAGPFNLTIKCAYRVRFGDPFREYVEHDFRLEQGHVEHEGSNEPEIAGNVIRVKGAGPELRLRVHGLDPRRDVVVRTRAQAIDETEAA